MASWSLYCFSVMSFTVDTIRSAFRSSRRRGEWDSSRLAASQPAWRASRFTLTRARVMFMMKL